MGDVATIITDPSVGQLEYLKRLQHAAPGVLPAFVTVEIETGELDWHTLKKSVAFLVKRHESIRTVFPFIDGEARQAVLPADENDARFLIEYIDLKTDQRSYEEVKKEYFTKAATIFLDVQNGPLTKFFLFEKAANSFCFFLLMHHIICDNWSKDIILGELILCYQHFASGHEPEIQPLKHQLRDYCRQQNNWLRTNRNKLNHYWRDKLEGYDNLFGIDGFYEGFRLRNNKPAWQHILQGQEWTLEKLAEIYGHPKSLKYRDIVTRTLFDKIKKLSALSRSTVSAVIYASFYLLLYRYAQKKKILLTALIADRLTPENQGIIGCLLGAIYFPREVTADIRIDDFIVRTHRDLFANLDYLIVSHEYIGLDKPRLRVCCDIHINYVHRRMTLSESLEETHVEIPGVYYPLGCAVFEYNDGFVFDWKYNKLLFEPSLIEDITRCHAEVLDFITANKEKTIGELAGFTR